MAFLAHKVAVYWTNEICFKNFGGWRSKFELLDDTV